MFHITNRCRLACPYCFAERNDLDFPAKSSVRMANLFRILGIQKIDISGGEPLLHEGLEAIIAGAAQQGIRLTITTSGVAPQSAIRFLLRNVDKFCRVIVSIDGPSSDEHNALRGSEEAWDSAVNLVRELVALGKRDFLRVNTVVTQPFVRNQWVAPMSEVVRSLGVSEWCLIQPHPANEKARFSKFAVSLDDFQRTANVASPSLGSMRLLLRPRTMYSEYFVLNPEGDLTQHSSSSKEHFHLNLLRTNRAELIRKRAEFCTIVPLVEEGSL